MTDEQLIALARRLLACPRFRWIPGIATRDGVRVLGARNERSWLERVFGHDGDDHQAGYVALVTGLPDLRDPATLGCIEHGLLPELYNDGAHLWLSASGDWHWGVGGVSWASGASKAETLVAALEAAPAE